MESNHSKFANNAKMWVKIDKLGNRTSMQRILNKLEKQIHKNLI